MTSLTLIPQLFSPEAVLHPNRLCIIADQRTRPMTAEDDQRQWEKSIAIGLIFQDEVRKTWIITHDDRTCARCRTLEDVTVDVLGSFTEGRTKETPEKPETVKYPPLHDACRCAMGLVEIDPL